MTAFLRSYLPCLLALALCGGCEEKKEDQPDPKSTEELRERLLDLLERYKVPGAGVALVDRDGVTWATGIGVADLAAGTAVTSETAFRMGSISKSFTALAALRLVEQGKLDLRTPLRELAPEVEFHNPWEATDPVRLVHLLEHTTGWDDIHLKAYAVNEPGAPLRDCMSFDPSPRTCRWPPGTAMSYCNAGPSVAGYVVEKIAGRPFDDHVREELLRPLGMATADFLLPDELRERLAHSYRPNSKTEEPYAHILDRPSGSLAATPTELAGLVRMLLNRGRVGNIALLKPESIVRMESATTTLAAAHGLKAGYGLGNYTTCESGFVFHGHNGAIDGFLASYGYLPEQGVGYVFAINAGQGAAFQKIATLVRKYLVRDLKPAEPPESRPTSLDELAGFYEPATPRQQSMQYLQRLFDGVWITPEGDHLRAWGLGQKVRVLVPLGEGLFREEKEPVATSVAFTDEGGELLFQGSLLEHPANYRAVPAWLAWSQGIVVVLCLALMALALLGVGWRWLIVKPIRWLRRRPAVPRRGVGGLSLLAIVCLAGSGLLLISQVHYLIESFGRITAWSVGLCVLTWLFAVCTVLGLMQTLRVPSGEVGRWRHGFWLLVGLANLTVLLYLGWWGVIGVRTWT